MPRPLTRRRFLAAAPAALAAPRFLRAAANDKLNVAFIGCGNQGFHLLTRTLRWDLARVVAVCDVNRGSTGYKEPSHFYGREPAKKLIDDTYKSTDCKAFVDFREVLARPEVDAVFLVVPDHWHAAAAVLAAAAGKHIYCEKPLTLGVAEGREIIAAVRNHKVIFQTGSHERSNPVSKFICEGVKGGSVGKVHKVVTTIGTNNKESPPPGWTPAPVPDGFDYARWLGPAPEVPYHPDRCLYRFRFHYDYSGGQITNFGAHCNDMAHWGLGLDSGGPTEVECLHAEFLPPGSLFNTATVTRFRCKYPAGVELVCETGNTGVQTRFEGSDGWVQTGYAGTTASRPELLKGLPKVDKKNQKEMDPHSLHVKDFVEAVKAGRDPAAPVEVGHASAVLCHVANAAIRRFPERGRQVLAWDAAAERFTNDEGANAALVRPRRSPWDKLPA